MSSIIEISTSNESKKDVENLSFDHQETSLVNENQSFFHRYSAIIYPLYLGFLCCLFGWIFTIIPATTAWSTCYFRNQWWAFFSNIFFIELFEICIPNVCDSIYVFCYLVSFLLTLASGSLIIYLSSDYNNVYYQSFGSTIGCFAIILIYALYAFYQDSIGSVITQPNPDRSLVFRDTMYTACLQTARHQPTLTTTVSLLSFATVAPPIVSPSPSSFSLFHRAPQPPPRFAWDRHGLFASMIVAALPRYRWYHTQVHSSNHNINNNNRDSCVVDSVSSTDDRIVNNNPGIINNNNHHKAARLLVSHRLQWSLVVFFILIFNLFYFFLVSFTALFRSFLNNNNNPDTDDTGYNASTASPTGRSTGLTFALFLAFLCISSIFRLCLKRIGLYLDACKEYTLSMFFLAEYSGLMFYYTFYRLLFESIDNFAMFFLFQVGHLTFEWIAYPLRVSDTFLTLFTSLQHHTFTCFTYLCPFSCCCIIQEDQMNFLYPKGTIYNDWLHFIALDFGIRVVVILITFIGIFFLLITIDYFPWIHNELAQNAQGLKSTTLYFFLAMILELANAYLMNRFFFQRKQVNVQEKVGPQQECSEHSWP